MKTYIADEKGISTVELLGAVLIFGIVIAMFSSTLHLIVQASTLQGRIVRYQQMANEIVAQTEGIAKTNGIYEQAGYLGKFDSLNFHEEHILKVIPEGASGENMTDQGSSRLMLTDINDTTNSRGRYYDTKDSNIKLKLIQQKNENEVTRTQYYTANYRDTFTIQTKVLLIFYTGDINFSDYYDYSTGWWQLADLLADYQEQAIYHREFSIQYRDDDKARGGVPGDGRW